MTVTARLDRKVWRFALLAFGLGLIARAVHRSSLGYPFGWWLFSLGVANLVSALVGFERKSLKKVALVITGFDLVVLGVGVLLVVGMLIVGSSSGDWSGWTGIH